VNDSFIKMSGVSRRSVIGKHGRNAFKWADDKERDNYFKLLDKDKKVDNYESDFIVGDA
jgi:hypothetical protein